MSRELLAMALDALIYHTNQTRPIERTDTAITALRAALAQPEPIAYGMPRADGLILDVITPEEHESYSGEYTVPLYAAPPAAPADAALNTLARLFHNGEEIEGDDGAAMMVDLSLWHEASEAFDSLIGDGDGETLASSAAPAVREPQPLVEIRRRTTPCGECHLPCGECHLQPGERCDICGARSIEQDHGIGGGGK